MPPPVESNHRLIAACGLYCPACGVHRKGRCAGCADNVKATWCKLRSCCAGKHIANCAGCGEHSEPRECRKFHNWISRVIGFILRSDRRACIMRIREAGPEAFAAEMAAKGAHSIRR